MSHRIWRAGLTVLVAAAALAVVLSLVHSPAATALPQAIPSPVAPDHTDVISAAMAYLATEQAADGGYGDMFTTIRVVLGTAAVSYPADTFETGTGTTPVDYLATNAITYTQNMTGDVNPGRAGSLLAAAVSAGADPTSFGGMDLVTELEATYSAATGAYSNTAYAASPLNQWWAIIGLAGAQAPVPLTATTYLADQQRADGGWAWGAAAVSSDPDSTAFALQALLASGHVAPWDAAVQDGLQYLADTQDDGGGWEVFGAISADTTAAAVQAFAAAGYTPVTHILLSTDGLTPHDALLALQNPDGSFAGFSAALSTADALMGLAEAPLPILGTVGRADLALSWIESRLLPDNSWPSAFGGRAGGTIDIVLSYAAAGYSPTTVHASGTTTSPLDYLAGEAAAYAVTPDAAGKLLAGVSASGLDVASFGGLNLVDTVNDTYSPTLSAFGVPTNTWHQSWAIIGLVGAGESLPAGVTDTLKGLQQSDGGWKFDLNPAPWNATGADSTGLAMQALIAAGVQPSDPAIVSATNYLKSSQTADGGWGFFGSLSANSTAYAIQGLAAAGEDVRNETWCQATACPITALESLQKPDGPFRTGWADDDFATQQAVPGLWAAPFPIPSAGLVAWAPVFTGYDPDRLFLRVEPDAAWGNSINVVLPFGSDLDRDGTVTVDYRVAGAADWITGTTVNRGAGVFTATIPVTDVTTYELEVTVADPDGVAFTTTVGAPPPFALELTPYRLFLPVILN